ncbi:hypothetical protein L3Y34_014012 [Caenorhabditis briggsae]|uniref:Uncharacterized protein n=1 Tax=Caenorhabditis briggsae TaxID=6238 RepID=A0AAE9IWR8_CAEBR|nr:hypothetical protein L3Y34_014012 [Caenorhabditis briggsae]
MAYCFWLIETPGKNGPKTFEDAFSTNVFDRCETKIEDKYLQELVPAQVIPIPQCRIQCCNTNSTNQFPINTILWNQVTSNLFGEIILAMVPGRCSQRRHQIAKKMQTNIYKKLLEQKTNENKQLEYDRSVKQQTENLAYKNVADGHTYVLRPPPKAGDLVVPTGRNYEKTIICSSLYRNRWNLAAGSQNQPQSFHAVAPPQYYSMYSIHQPQPMMPGTPQSAPHPTVGPQSEQQPKQPANPTQGQPILYQQTPHGFVPVQWQPQNPYSMMPCDVPQMPFYFPQYPAARDPELPLPRFNGDSHDYYGFLHSFTARFDNRPYTNSQRLQFLKEACSGPALKIRPDSLSMALEKLIGH